MTPVLAIASGLQVVVGAVGSPTVRPSSALGCLGLLLTMTLLPIISFLALRVRSFLKHSGGAKPDFTSLRSTGKTIVNTAQHDDDDPDQFGNVK